MVTPEVLVMNQRNWQDGETKPYRLFEARPFIIVILLLYKSLHHRLQSLVITVTVGRKKPFCFQWQDKSVKFLTFEEICQSSFNTTNALFLRTYFFKIWSLFLHIPRTFFSGSLKPFQIKWILQLCTHWFNFELCGIPWSKTT